MVCISNLVTFFCRGPYNAERDWPDPDDSHEENSDDEDMVDAANAGHQLGSSTQDPVQAILNARRGSSEETKVRRRKRFETYRV